MYLDSLDSYYYISHDIEPKQKPKKDYSNYLAIAFMFIIIGIIIGSTIYTYLEIYIDNRSLEQYKTWINNDSGDLIK
jgi:hypothetical protein